MTWERPSEAPRSLASRVLHTRWVVRAPIHLYRLGLGRVLGDRMLLLEHRGRSSGLLREVVLEVVDRPSAGVMQVVAGLGPTSQWYRNVLADPRVVASSGKVARRRALADVLDVPDAVAVLDAYRTEHGTAWEKLEPVLAEWARPAASPGQDWRELVPVVELTLVD
ncbi:hypothetical protein GCM10025865_15450 [Paraoerskovia sediminicola]|uniref:Deazaflavin-dependent oxidoreductase, nitroreductase family n=1 Tax=Paraoerskovia sediminicola TaxID=1138587 RepID=A0ABM8G2M4_9CELL|nr:nitroreductase family deazaflavin-dependent oxidoreductase [Paraoerskovia sediminicola]BDZ42246.1 hypothetical protein GCM10025865_15450 [Paraoerskovia sediminicola]